jgi:hypothetical protein
MEGLSNMFFLMIKKHLSFIRYEVFSQNSKLMSINIINQAQ